METVICAMHGPAKVVACGFKDRIRDCGKVGGNMVLKTTLADIAQQLLHVGDLYVLARVNSARLR